MFKISFVGWGTDDCDEQYKEGEYFELDDVGMDRTESSDSDDANPKDGDCSVDGGSYKPSERASDEDSTEDTHGIWIK